MRVYQEARFEDLGQRLANDQELTPEERHQWNSLCAEKQREEESRPRPWLYGGDYVDAF